MHRLLGFAQATALAIALAWGPAACNSGESGSETVPVTSAPSGTAPSTTTAAACSPPRLAAPGAAPITYPFGGQERSYLLTLPAGYDGRKAYPLLFSLHGFASNKETIESTTSLARDGARRGYVVVTPDSLPPQWNMFGGVGQADDFGFVHALVDDLEQRLCIDTDRVFAAGHSNGAAFAAFLVCQPPYVFAAVAMVSATTPLPCPADINPAVVAIAGTADPQVPFAGGPVGGGPVVIPPALDTVAAYAARNGCDPTPSRDTPASSVERLTFDGCDPGSAVVFYTVVDGSHAWPVMDSLGATEAILDFFDAQDTQ